MIFSQTIIASRKKNRHIGPYAMTYLIFVLTIGGEFVMFTHLFQNVTFSRHHSHIEKGKNRKNQRALGVSSVMLWLKFVLISWTY